MAVQRQANEVDDRVLTGTRWLAGVVTPVLVVAFFMLYLLPNNSGLLFAWPIKPTMSAMMLGATYLGGAYFFTRALLTRSWRSIRLGLLPVSAFAGILGIATVLHWDKFTHGHVSFWLWALLYFTLPFLIPLVWLRNQQAAPGGGAQREPHFPRLLRLALGVLGAVLAAVSLLLLLFPQALIPSWPWPLSPLTARVLAAEFMLPGLVGLGVARRRALERGGHHLPGPGGGGLPDPGRHAARRRRDRLGAARQLVVRGRPAARAAAHRLGGRLGAACPAPTGHSCVPLSVALLAREGSADVHRRREELGCAARQPRPPARWGLPGENLFSPTNWRSKGRNWRETCGAAGRTCALSLRSCRRTAFINCLYPALARSGMIPRNRRRERQFKMAKLLRTLTLLVLLAMPLAGRAAAPAGIPTPTLKWQRAAVIRRGARPAGTHPRRWPIWTATVRPR